MNSNMSCLVTCLGLWHPLRLNFLNSNTCFYSRLYGKYMCNHVKLELCSFFMNFNSEGFSLRILYFVVDTGYGLCRSLGDCRLAFPKGLKYQIVKKQTDGRSGFPLPLRLAEGRLVCICHAGLLKFSHASQQ